MDVSKLEREVRRLFEARPHEAGLSVVCSEGVLDGPGLSEFLDAARSLTTGERSPSLLEEEPTTRPWM